jgi:WD40 repeat protein
METSARIFISYSRSDGRAFAEDFERKLKSEGIHAWRDIHNMGSGVILPQVLRAIEDAEHFAVILSQRALVSDWIKREWSHARWVGKMVSPIRADRDIEPSDLPAWIRREETYNIADRERWTKLVQVLKGPGKIKRAPYMPGDLPEGFVLREIEYAALKEAVLAQSAENKTLGLTTALRGAGGYGKTTLANYLCHDPDVQFEFTDGIVRVEIGKERSDVIGLVTDLIERLDPDGKRPGFTDIVTASEYLGELIGESRLLLVIDDVWRAAQLLPFLRGGPNCARLVTTRLPGVLPLSHVPIKIDEMRAGEAARLISRGLPIEIDPSTQVRLAALAKRLENWAQALSMANRWIDMRVSDGEKLTDAIQNYEERLNELGLTGFDPERAEQRDRAIGICIEASLNDLDDGERARFGELAVLPEDENVPLYVIEALWAESAGFNKFKADDLVRLLNGLSLLQNLDLGKKTLRLHDNMTWYLRDRAGTDGYRAAHATMVKALSKGCEGHWEQLPKKAVYAWKFLIRHLRLAGQDSEADQLLTNYSWIKAKLHEVGARALFSSYSPESPNEDVGVVGRAIALSVPALTAYPHDFPRQIFGRLGHFESGAAKALAVAARADPDLRPPLPRWPGLTPPGAERLRFIGHKRPVRSARFSPDGTRIVTASLDGTARLWDAPSGQELAVLRGHEDGVNSASFSPDGVRIVTASEDRTVRLWDAGSGQGTTVLRGHEDRVLSVSFSPDGARIVTASADHTARLWDTRSGQGTTVLCGHEGGVNSASFSPDGARIITASADRTAWLWDAGSGQGTTLRGHEGGVNSASFSPDGARIVTASADRTARLWDARSGQGTTVLRGHEGGVNSASFSLDGARIVTASADRTARLWDTRSGQGTTVLRGHVREVRSAYFSPDSARIVTASADRTARLWDTRSGRGTTLLRGHVRGVWGVSFSPDGGSIVTASADRTARLWDARSGRALPVVLRGHEGPVWGASFSPDGACIVTASDDRTARLWNMRNGRELAVLRGHEGPVRSANFSLDGARILTASLDATARLWDARSGWALPVVLRGHEGPVWGASFSPDGARIVTASADRTARLWDASTLQELAVLRGHVRQVLGASFSPDSARIITASLDHTARLWDASSLQERAVLRGHEGRVLSARFLSDGACIVTASTDYTARVWDERGRELALIALDAEVNALDVRGSAITLGDRLGRIHVFEAEELESIQNPGVLGRSG